MFSVRTLLKKDNTFIPIEEWKGAVSDPKYVAGALVIKQDEEIILDEKLWDDINYLWPYIVNGLIPIANGEDFQTGFPDQPVFFQVKHLPYPKDWLLLKVFSGDEIFVNIKISKVEFLDEVIASALIFFTKIKSVCPGCDIPLAQGMGTLEKAIKLLNAKKGLDKNAC